MLRPSGSGSGSQPRSFGFVWLVRANAELARKASRDSLTGVLARGALLERLADRLRDAHGRPFVIGMLDVDHFKAINDTHGHDAGDKVLAYMGDLFRQNLQIRFRNSNDETQNKAQNQLNKEAMIRQLRNIEIDCPRHNNQCCYCEHPRKTFKEAKCHSGIMQIHNPNMFAKNRNRFC